MSCRSPISQRLGVVFGRAGRAARGEPVTGRGSLHDASHEPPPMAASAGSCTCGHRTETRASEWVVVRRPLGHPKSWSSSQ